jgi:hypothetical protein
VIDLDKRGVDPALIEELQDQLSVGVGADSGK